jgi:predicted alpha/beta hydrolase family esterase
MRHRRLYATAASARYAKHEKLVRADGPARHNDFPDSRSEERIMFSCARSTWPPRLVTVPGLHGSEGAHWQTWLERQFAHSLRVEQGDWDAPDLAGWARSVRNLLTRERGPFVLAAHSFGCLAAARALFDHATATDIAGVLFVAPASPAKFAFAGMFEARRLGVPSIMIGSESDPWMPLADARELALRLGSAFVNLGDAGHINTAAGYGPWPRAKYFVDTLAHCAAPLSFEEPPIDADGPVGLIGPHPRHHRPDDNIASDDRSYHGTHADSAHADSTHRYRARDERARALRTSEIPWP